MTYTASHTWPPVPLESPSTPAAGPVEGKSAGSALGVIDAQGLWPAPRRLELPLAAITGADAIGRLAARYQLGQVWLHDSALEPLGYSEAAEYWQPLRSDGHSYVLAVPSWAAKRTAGPWAAACTGPELLAALTAYSETVGVPWQKTAGVTSDWLINQRWHHRVRPAQEPELIKTAEFLRSNLHYVWFRRPTSEELKARWAHVFDPNGAYLAAASRQNLPEGVPARQLRKPIIFDKRRAGYWLIEPPPPRPDLPDPFDPQADEPARRRRPVWLTTPAARLALELGAAQPSDAWVWGDGDNQHAYLDHWYRALSAARSHFVEDGPPLALAAVKLTYTHGIGKLGSVDRRRGETDPLFHPYWRWAVMAEARRRLYIKLAGYTAPPAATFVDGCLFFSNIEDPVRAATKLGLAKKPGLPPLGMALGEWKHEYTMPGRPVAQALERAGDNTEAFHALRELRKQCG